MKLYELTEEHKQLQALADEGNPDLSQAIADTFEGIEGEFNDKAQSLITVVNNMSSDTNAIDAEIKRLQERKKTIQNRQQSMRDYLRYNMELTGIGNIKCPLFSITLAKGRDIAVITDEDSIPVDYVEMEMVKKINKAELLKALKSGEVIPGAELSKSKNSLRIK